MKEGKEVLHTPGDSGGFDELLFHDIQCPKPPR